MTTETRSEKLKRESEKQDKLEKEVISCADFRKIELPPNRWVVDKLIPEGMTILSSAPGQYKTYLLLALCKQIAKGEMGFNHFSVEKKNILFVNEEMGKRAMQDRLKTINSEEENLYLTNLSGVKLDDFVTILKICKEKDIKLVVFDSLTRIHNLSENDASDVKKIFEAVVILLKEDISVIITHHHRKAPIIGQKNGSDEMRGSTDLLAMIDCHLAIDCVSSDKTYIIVKQLKLRQAENLPDFKLDIERDRENNKISFVYKGEFNQQDAKNIKIENNKEIVLNIIKDNPGITKDEIFKALNGKIGEMAIKAILPALEKDNVIYSKTNKPKTYFLREEIDDLFTKI